MPDNPASPPPLRLLERPARLLPSRPAPPAPAWWVRWLGMAATRRTR